MVGGVLTTGVGFLSDEDDCGVDIFLAALEGGTGLLLERAGVEGIPAALFKDGEEEEEEEGSLSAGVFATGLGLEDEEEGVEGDERDTEGCLGSLEGVLDEEGPL